MKLDREALKRNLPAMEHWANGGEVEVKTEGSKSWWLWGGMAAGSPSWDTVNKYRPARKKESSREMMTRHLPAITHWANGGNLEFRLVDEGEWSIVFTAPALESKFEYRPARKEGWVPLVYKTEEECLQHNPRAIRVIEVRDDV